MGPITSEVVDTGEKRDVRGRRIAAAEWRQQMVQAYRVAGTTMAEFARRERIKYATFAGWVAKAAAHGSAKPPIRFAQVALPLRTATAPTDPLEVRFADGTVVRGSRVNDLVALVRALRA